MLYLQRSALWAPPGIVAGMQTAKGENRMKYRYLLLALLICALSVLTGCRYFLPREVERVNPPLVEPTKITFDTYEVKRVDVSSGVKAVVNVDYTKDNLTAVNLGAFKSFPFTSGGSYKKGDVIAEFYPYKADDPAYEQELTKLSGLISQKYQFARDNTNDAELDSQIADSCAVLNSVVGSPTQIKAPYDGFVFSMNFDRITTIYTMGEDMVFGQFTDPKSIRITYSGPRVGMLKNGSHVQLVSDNGTYRAVVQQNAEYDTATFNFAAGETKRPEFGEILQVQYFTETHAGVLAIPKNLIKKYQGKKFVEILTPDQKKKECVLETGLEDADDTLIEIVSGLNEGDQIIIR